MQIEIDLGKSLEENASVYFEKSKKAKRKLLGLAKAIEATQQKIRESEKKQEKEISRFPKKRKTAWFEAFRWFNSSDGFLVVGGRNAKSNELLVKKHFDENDLFLHADIQGGAACIVKVGNRRISDTALGQAAVFAAVFSKAWQQGLAAVDVYAVKKSQVSKKAKAGEFVGKGGFIINGSRKWFRKTGLDFAVGIKKQDSGFLVVSGPREAVEQNSLFFARVGQGKQDVVEAAKCLMRLFGEKAGQKLHISLDEFVKMLPSSSLEVFED